MYAGFWKRAVAYIIDIVIFYGIIYFVITIFSSADGTINNHIKSLLGWFILLFMWVYFVMSEASSWQATLGKRIVGIKVTDLNGNRISLWRSFMRNISSFLTKYTLFIGYLMCFWTKRKQCLHDKIAKCLVVDKNYVPEQTQNAPAKTPWKSIVLCLCLLAAIIVLPAFLRQYQQASEVVAAIQLTKHLQQTAVAQRNPQKARQTNEYTDFYCIKGPQTVNPQNKYASCGTEKTWLLALGPRGITAWRTNSFKYRLTVPYNKGIPQCDTEEDRSRFFVCEKLASEWNSQRQ